MFENTSNHQSLDPGHESPTRRKDPIMTHLKIEIVAFFLVTQSAIACFGIVTNIINLNMFYKQGFKNVVNITFFGIAFSDFFTLIFLLWTVISMSPSLHYADVPFVFNEVYYPIAGLPHVFLSRITMFYTAFLTTERCLSVLVPLKVHRVITPRRTVIILVLLALMNVFIAIPEYLGASLKWNFYPERNKTLLGLVYNHNSDIAVLSFIFAPPTAIMAFATVVVFTAILVYQLRKKSQWRKSATHDNQQGGAMSTKEKGTIRMVIVIASILIFLNIPGVALPWVTVAVPEFHLSGEYVNLFKTVWGVPLLFQGINSSVNVFFYYRMSSSYRQHFRQLFPICFRNKEGRKGA